jgi:hypothetical protein
MTVGLFVAWTDRQDIDDGWLSRLRDEWDDRLSDLYGIE